MCLPCALYVQVSGAPVYLRTFCPFWHSTCLADTCKIINQFPQILFKVKHNYNEQSLKIKYIQLYVSLPKVAMQAHVKLSVSLSVAWLTHNDSGCLDCKSPSKFVQVIKTCFEITALKETLPIQSGVIRATALRSHILVRFEVS